MRHFRPVVEARINQFREKEGNVLFGGAMQKDWDETLAIPDNLGGRLAEPSRPQT